jgi:hypothetical protein
MTRSAGVIGSLVLAASSALVAQSPQSPPPVNGVTGTVALDDTTNAVYRALNVAIVQTVDGVEHVIHFTRHLFAHGKGTNVD